MASDENSELLLEIVDVKLRIIIVELSLEVCYQTMDSDWIRTIFTCDKYETCHILEFLK